MPDANSANRASRLGRRSIGATIRGQVVEYRVGGIHQSAGGASIVLAVHSPGRAGSDSQPHLPLPPGEVLQRVSCGRLGSQSPGPSTVPTLQGCVCRTRTTCAGGVSPPHRCRIRMGCAPSAGGYIADAAGDIDNLRPLPSEAIGWRSRPR
jgi:hypothetical protein